jgi:hypothetical protein
MEVVVVDMEPMSGFLGWLCEHEPERYGLALVDIEVVRSGLRRRAQPVELGTMARDAAWRVYGLAAGYGFADAAAYVYEVYELVCRSLAYALEGTW